MIDSVNKERDNWQQAARVYQERADEYDGWYDDSLLFKIELAALQQVAQPLPEPRIEIGAGPGRFAEQLGVSVGIDPAPAALRHAAARGIMGVAGIGEQMPVQSSTAGTIFMLFTLCFLLNPVQVLRECHRLLKKDGCLIIGQIPGQSAWGQLLENKKRQGHPFYEYARFYTIDETLTMLQQAGFTLLESHSTLLQPPDSLKRFESAESGSNEQAGFCVLVAKKSD